MKADHICAFARSDEDQTIIVGVAREFALLISGENNLPIGRAVWEDTLIEIPETPHPTPQTFRNILTDEHIESTYIDGRRYLEAANVFGSFSVGVLVSE